MSDASETPPESPEESVEEIDAEEATPENSEESVDEAEESESPAAATTERDFTLYRWDGERVEPSVPLKVAEYDFSNPGFFSEAELRQVRIRHEQFVHYLSARLSMFFRMDFLLKLLDLTTVPFREYVGSIPSPSCITMFELEPLAGTGFLDLRPRTAMSMVERMLGGSGSAPEEERYLTEIEGSLLEEVMGAFLEEWSRQWSDLRELKPVITGGENNSRFLQCPSSNSVMLVARFECGFGGGTEPLQIAVPFYTIKPVIEELREKGQREREQPVPDKAPAWLDSYDDIPVPLSAEWDLFEITLGDLSALRQGDILELPLDLLRNTRVCLRNAPRFRGEVGLDGEFVAIRLTDCIEERV